MRPRKRFPACPECGGAKSVEAALCATCHIAKLHAGTELARTCPRCKGRKKATAALCRGCVNALTMPTDDRKFPINGKEAARYGATVTLENESGETLTVHRTGSVRRAVNAALDYAETVDPTYRVVTVSTPTSIFRDLQGARQNVHHNHGDKAQLPELSLGLGARLHPRLLSAGEHPR